MVRRTVLGVVISAAFVLITVPITSFGQGNGLPEETSELDFWIGSWTVNGGGVDKVKRFGDGIAILETYTSNGVKGWSVNTYDKKTGTWTQTWHIGTIFSQFTGRKVGDEIILVTDAVDPSDGVLKPLRLKFSNIKKNSFDQVYEKSNDGGVTWIETSRNTFVRIR
jgi:hypothetical protein